MKRIITSIILAFLAFCMVRWSVFNITLDDTVLDQSVTTQGIFQKERDAFVDQQLKFQGVVVESYYLLGIGYYKLQDSKGDAISVFCNHYPPPGNELIEVIVYVRPLLKVDNSLTLELEVIVPEVLLSSPKILKNQSL